VPRISEAVQSFNYINYETIDCTMIFQSSIYIILATLIYSCCIADTKTSTVSRFVNRTIPTWIMRNIERGSLQLVYLVVVLGSWTIIFTYGYPAIDSSNHIDSRHKYAGYAVFFMCMTSWLYASNTCPGNVTAETMQLFDHYEYDNVLYKNRECPTLKIRKIARSKYDRYTKRHGEIWMLLFWSKISRGCISNLYSSM
jgi:hypothetical protein